MFFFGSQVPVVARYPYLGILLDVGLTFNALLNSLLARGWTSFNSFLGAAYSRSLAFPLMATSIPNGVESVCLYGMELCVGSQRVEFRLDRMQVGWAEALLGVCDCTEGSWPVLLAECGWVIRLGANMLERAIMLSARLQLLPPCHPAALLFHVAQGMTATTWLSEITKWQRSLKLPAHIPEPSEASAADELFKGRSCKLLRIHFITVWM